MIKVLIENATDGFVYFLPDHMQNEVQIFVQKLQVTADQEGSIVGLTPEQLQTELEKSGFDLKDFNASVTGK